MKSTFGDLEARIRQLLQHDKPKELRLKTQRKPLVGELWSIMSEQVSEVIDNVEGLRYLLRSVTESEDMDYVSSGEDDCVIVENV